MKKRIWLLLIMQLVLITFSGCAVYDFFDVRSTMAPPHSSKEESAVENAIYDYLKSDFKFCQLFVEGRYSSVLRFNFNEAEYMVVFCQVEDEESVVHIMLLEKGTGDWLVKDDVEERDVKFDNVRVAYTSREDICEMIAEGIDLNTDLPIMLSYQVDKNKITSIMGQ